MEGAASARENGPVDNFGAFVQSQPDQGLRGRELAKALEAEPERAEQILEQESLTRDDFEAMLYDIAADPELSRLYNAAMAH